jgi:hypothetical protein
MPTDKPEVESEARTDPFVVTSAPDPIGVLPSRNVTVPVAMQQGDMAAVRITDCPNVAGLALDVSVVLVLSVTD